MRARTDLTAGLFIGSLLFGAWFLFFGATPARASGEICANGSPSPCVEDIQITVCNKCHSIAIPGGNRNGTDRQVTGSSLVNRGASHVLDPLSDRGAWATIVSGMLAKFGLATDSTPIAGYLNTNYSTTSTGPILGSPMQSNVDLTTATVTWSTSANGFEDEPADSVVFYGKVDADVLSCMSSPSGCPGVAVAVDSTPVAHHVVNLTDLSCNSKYFMKNRSTSPLGTTTSLYTITFRTKACLGVGAPSRVYLAEDESGASAHDRIIVIDPAINTQLLPSVAITGTNPAELAAYPDGSIVYAMVGTNLSVIETATNTEVDSLPAAGGLFNHLAVSPDGKKLYLVYKAGSDLQMNVYDVTIPAAPVSTALITSQIWSSIYAPLGLAISPDGSRLYLAARPGSGSSSRFYIVDTATNTPAVTQTFPGEFNNLSINALAVTPDGAHVYVIENHTGGGTVEIFNELGIRQSWITLPTNSHPTAGVVSTDGSKLYVVAPIGIHVIDTATNTLLLTLPQATSGGAAIGLTPDGSKLYTSSGSNVFVNETATNNPVATITGDFTAVSNLVITVGQPAAQVPDVVMTVVTPNSATAVPGDVLSITDTVKNQGQDSTLSGFEVAYSLSPTPSYDDPAAAALQTIRFVGPLGVGATDTATTNLAIPYFVTEGNYYVCAKADPTQALAESNGDNNTLCSATTVQVSMPDLVMTAVSPNASSAAPGGGLSVTDTAKNQGGATTTVTSFVAYSLSVNSIYGDSDDLPITSTRAVGSLAPGATNTGTTNLAMPSTISPNNYHVCATADSTNVVTESVETNNSLCSTATITVSTPDLVMSAVSTTATVAATGGSLTLSNTAKNVGSGTAGAFTIAFHLSTNTTYGDGDDIAFTATRSVSGLDPGLTNTASTALVVPSTTPVGNYYICALADSGSAVNEGGGVGENNNSLCTGTTVQVIRPDLVMTAVTPNAATVSTTAKLSVTNTVKNQGAVSASSVKVGFNLSPTPNYNNPAAVAIATTRTVSTLAAGASNTATTTLTIANTTPPGNYYVCAKADPADTVAELDEGNNTLCSAGTVTVPPADLTMTAVSTTATNVAPGKTLSLSNTAKNQGLFPAGPFTIGFHLSTNTTYGDGDDVAMTTTRSLASLASGSSSSSSTTLTLPAATPFGPYHVCAMADSGHAVDEGSPANENNNSLCTSATIQVTGPDLIMTAVTPNATTVRAGLALSVTSTVKNQGLLTTGASMYIAFHLSLNTTYGDGDDVVMPFTRLVGALAAGASSTTTNSWTIPGTTPLNTYYLCAMADSLGTIGELDESNNTFCSTVQVTVTP